MQTTTAPATVTLISWEQAPLTAFNAGSTLFHISASYATKSFTGGRVGILLLALDRETFHYTPVIRVIEGIVTPTFRKLRKAEILEQIGYELTNENISSEQAAALCARFK